MSSPHQLTRRERQIMDVVYSKEQATAAEIREGLPDPPSYSAVRALLAKLVQKGHLTHEADGPRYVYSPTVPRAEARESALKRMLHTFFAGSASEAMTALLAMQRDELRPEELEELSQAIEEAKRQGR